MKALSWSELYTWEQDPAGHKAYYIDGVMKPATESMNLGTIIHKTIAEPRYPWLEEMVKNGYDQKKINAARKILDKVFRPKESEVVLRSETKEGIPLIAVFDGLDRGQRILDEYKTTTTNGRWTEGTVNHFGQLSFYALVWNLLTHGWFREIRLHRLNMNTGRSRTYHTVRGPLDILDIERRIIRCYHNLAHQGLWEKRLTRRERGKALNATLPL